MGEKVSWPNKSGKLHHYPHLVLGAGGQECTGTLKALSFNVLTPAVQGLFNPT